MVTTGLLHVEMPEKQNFLEKLKNTMTHSERISIKFKEVLLNNFVNDKD